MTAMRKKAAQLAIDEYINHWRSQKSWRAITTYPKLHVLEDHALDFMGHLPIGLGLLNEEGNDMLGLI